MLKRLKDIPIFGLCYITLASSPQTLTVWRSFYSFQPSWIQYLRVCSIYSL